MKFPMPRVETIHILDGEEVNAYIKKVTGRKIDPVRDGDVPGDDSEGYLTLTANGKGSTNASRAAYYDKFCAGGEGHGTTILSFMLDKACAAGEIPAGKYHIHYTWG